MKLTLGFSPCPNDTFIFDALVNQKIDTEGLTFEYRLEDIATLNKLALRDTFDITKISIYAYSMVSDNYILFQSGGALGENCGPLLIAKKEIDTNDATLKVAIPGKWTTANFLLSEAYPHLQDKQVRVFSEIEQAVLDEEVDAGVIIHENRFTYADKGLVKIRDLGEFWEQTYQMPLPLGGICARRDLPDDVLRKVQRLISQSVEYALEHPTSSESFTAQHAQEMDPAVRMSHINLYVNKYSVDVGWEGEQAVQKMLDLAIKTTHISQWIPTFMPKNDLSRGWIG